MLPPSYCWYRNGEQVTGFPRALTSPENGTEEQGGKKDGGDSLETPPFIIKVSEDSARLLTAHPAFPTEGADTEQARCHQHDCRRFRNAARLACLRKREVVQSETKIRRIVPV